jgi:hypothetical protein
VKSTAAAILAALAIAGCANATMEPQVYSYSVDRAMPAADQAAVGNGYEEWKAAVGLSFPEHRGPVVTWRLGNPPAGTDGQTTFHSQDDMLAWARVNVQDHVWTGDPAYLRLVLLHEIGHTLGLPHSSECGSLMHIWFCGATGIDPASAAQANANIDQGWVERETNEE